MVWENKTRVPAALGLRGYSFFAGTEIRESCHLMSAKLSVCRGKRNQYPYVGDDHNHVSERKDQFTNGVQIIRRKHGIHKPYKCILRDVLCINGAMRFPIAEFINLVIVQSNDLFHALRLSCAFITVRHFVTSFTW